VYNTSIIHTFNYLGHGDLVLGQPLQQRNFSLIALPNKLRLCNRERIVLCHYTVSLSSRRMKRAVNPLREARWGNSAYGTDLVFNLLELNSGGTLVLVRGGCWTVTKTQ